MYLNVLQWVKYDCSGEGYSSADIVLTWQKGHVLFIQIVLEVLKNEVEYSYNILKDICIGRILLIYEKENALSVPWKPEALLTIPS